MARGAALFVLTALLAVTSAPALAVDLSGMTNRQYGDYVRDRFETLVGEGRTSHRMAVEYQRACERQRHAGDEDGPACEVARIARERCAAILEEEDELLRGVRERFGRVPAWARDADEALVEALHS